MQRLREKCEHQGRPVVVKEQFYYCNQTNVTLEFYEANIANPNSGCRSLMHQGEMCFCPADKFGEYCEFNNYI